MHMYTFIQSRAACLASWFSVEGPRCPDCSAPPLSVNQLTKLSTADSPLRKGTIFSKLINAPELLFTINYKAVQYVIILQYINS